MKIIVTGGGTGGHIYAAIAIAKYFEKIDKNNEIVYIGGKYGVENEIVPKYGYKMYTIDIKGFQRKISFENVKRVAKTVISMGKVKKIIKKEKPDLVIGTGGYVSGPVVYEAALRKIKTAILEQNVFMGMANKILSKKVDHIFYGFNESFKRYNFKNAIFSGNPVRYEEFSYKKDEAREQLGYNKEDKIILSVGGSYGSANLNEIMQELSGFLENENIKLVHVCGEDFYPDMKDFIENVNYKNIKFFPYLDSIGKYVCASDLVICSAGAGTVSEVSYAGKPMIVVPKAYTADNHQEYNAKMVEENGAGFYILEDNLDLGVLKEDIVNIIFNKETCEKMGKNSKKLSNDDSCKVIYDVIMKDFENEGK